MTSFKQYLLENNARSVEFTIEGGLDTIGKLMNEFQTLNTIIKELAINDEWSTADFKKVKALKVSPDALQGKLTKSEVISRCKNTNISAIGYFTSAHHIDANNDTIEFIAESMHEWYLTLKVRDHIYRISTDETVNETLRGLVSAHDWNNMLDYTKHIVHYISIFVNAVKNQGRKAALDNVFSDIGALILFV